VWLIGIFHRGLWTPDEPREADIAWRMSQQSDRTLPHLADMPFLEKPPLSYWLSAASIEKSGDSPAAARAPNILYAMVTALSLGALAFAMSAVARGAGTGPTAGRSAERAVADGRAALTPVERRKGATAAFLAAMFAATALIVFRVEVWLAPDAGLLAGCSLALLGAWLGLSGALLSFGIGVVLGALFATIALALPAARRESNAWRTAKLPLGTFLCIGGIISALWGPPIIDAYKRWAGF